MAQHVICRSLSSGRGGGGGGGAAKATRGRHFIRDGGGAAAPPKAMLDPGLTTRKAGGSLRGLHAGKMLVHGIFWLRHALQPSVDHGRIIARRPTRGKGGRQTHSCKAASYLPVQREVPSTYL